MAVKASDHFKTYHNPNGPDITTVSRTVLEQGGYILRISMEAERFLLLTIGVCLAQSELLLMSRS